MTNPLSRRRFLGGAAGLSASAVLGSSVLSACGGESTPKIDPKAESVLPMFQAQELVVADLLPSATGVTPACYFNYPADLVKTVAEVPGGGGDLTAVFKAFAGLPPALDKNPFWQGMNERLGVNFKPEIVPDADYDAKIATLFAGGDLPDLMQIYTDTPRFAEIAQAKFTDLTPYLAGDKILDYPNLAAIPTTSWRNSALGGIWGVPRNALVQNAMIARADFLSDRGMAAADVETIDDFLEVCKALTDPSKTQYALADPGYDRYGSFQYFKESFGAPNQWLVEDGKFIWEWETEQNKEALASIVKFFEAGVFHPDSFSPTLDLLAIFYNGTIGLQFQGLDNVNYYTSQLNADGGSASYAPLYPTAYEDGKHRVFGERGYDSITPITKPADEDRVEELLRVLDWMAAPFGSEERHYVLFGLEGRHYTETDGMPTLTDTGWTEVKSLFTTFLGQPAQVLFNAGRPEEETTSLWAFCDRSEADIYFDPTINLYSDTASRKYDAIRKPVVDTVAEIMKGNQPISALDDAVSSWRSAGGDTIRTEYEAAYAEAN